MHMYNYIMYIYTMYMYMCHLYTFLPGAAEQGGARGAMAPPTFQI